MRTASQHVLSGGPATHLALAHQASVPPGGVDFVNNVASSGVVTPPAWLVACEHARRSGDDVNALAERIAIIQGASLVPDGTGPSYSFPEKGTRKKKPNPE